MGYDNDGNRKDRSTMPNSSAFRGGVIAVVFLLVSTWAGVLVGFDGPTAQRVLGSEQSTLYRISSALTAGGKLSHLTLFVIAVSVVILALLIVRGRFWFVLGLMIPILPALAERSVARMLSCSAFGPGEGCGPINPGAILIFYAVFLVPGIALAALIKWVRTQDSSVADDHATSTL
jgi:hypothetical protein